MDPGEGVGAPRGEFLSWQPGATPSFGRSWRLTKGSDLVLQLHMRPGGKPEPIQSSLAFYFTDEPPARPAFSFMLRSTTIDIPAGEKNYIVDSEYTLPVDVELTGILPHAHYLGKQLEAWAILPDQTRQPLILIKNWDFNWQGDYLYATPLSLPRGTRLCMRYSFDNSEQNPRNPNHPPKRVRYGLNSTDEMAELSLQMVPLKAEDLPILIRDNMAKYAIPDSIARSRNVLKDAPDDATAHAKLGSALATGGQIEEGLKELRRAIALEPANVLAHFNLAVLLVSQGKIAEGTQEYEQVLRLDWNHYRAHNNLGLIYFKQGRLDLAARHFYNAIRINPNDDLANSNLARLFLTEGKLGQAKLQLEKLLEIIPDDPSAKAALAKVSEEISKRR
jgi:tetratricopeptide (TPR) repeat protein